MVTTRKKNSKPRRIVDMQVLSKHAVRETHHNQVTFHQAMLVPSGPKKTITDACDGYHSVPYREEDRHTHLLCTCVRTNTKLVHRSTQRDRTGTPEDSTRLPMTFPTKPNASTTHAYVQTLSKEALSKKVCG